MFFDDIVKCVDFNLIGFLYLIKVVINLMLKNGNGSVVFILLVNVIWGYFGVVVYSVIKVVIDGLICVFVCELGIKKIRVNLVVFGYFESDMVGVLIEFDKVRIKRRIFFGRIVIIIDIVESVLFLCLEKVSFVIG